MRVSYLEIYNEEIRDLLHPDTPSKSIAVRESEGGDVLIVGVQDEEVNDLWVTVYCILICDCLQVRCAEDMYRCFNVGSTNRTTAGTLMNSSSSRSHSIFSIIVEQDFGDERDATTAKFHLVDLAGYVPFMAFSHQYVRGPCCASFRPCSDSFILLHLSFQYLPLWFA